MPSESPARLVPKSTGTWLSDKELAPVIKDFLNHYSQTHWHHLATRAKELIEQEVSKPCWNDVHINVRARGKEEKSLKDKLIIRHQDNPYKIEQDILDDIHDLAGARIILYMPSEDQREKTQRIIRNIWGEDVKPKYHEGTDERPKPEDRSQAMLQVRGEERKQKKKYRRRHLGYTAVHYRCKMKPDHQKQPEYSYKAGDKVEIQVVSALSHAWAEAGHDILYKSYAYGAPTLQEELLLDSLNGIVLSGDLLLEQFHELVMKRTYAKFRDHADLDTFLRDLDVLQPQNDKDERPEFDGAGLEVFLRFLRETEKDFPLAVRDAFKKLSFPREPKLANYMAQKIRPTFTPAKNMLAIICLLHSMLQDIEPKPAPPITRPKEQCYTMLNALTLLQSFFPRPDRANSFLKELRMEDAQLESLDFVLNSCRRQLLLDDKDELLSDKDDDADIDAEHDDDSGLWVHKLANGEPGDGAGYEAYEKKIGPQLRPAWDWFQGQAKIDRSICGMVFRLAVMGAAKKSDWALLLGQLRIGGIISRASTGSINGDV